MFTSSWAGLRRYRGRRQPSSLASARRWTAPATKKKGVSRRLQLELLEDRRVLASYLSTIFDDSQLNSFEDQSREAFIDVNQDNAARPGDVLVGFARIDDHFPPVGGIGSTGNKV
jgi:hypothetical protein